MTLRLTSKEGRLNASFTEMEKKQFISTAEGSEYNEKFYDSFQPITLSEEASDNLIGYLDTLEADSVELSEKECEVFEVIKDLHNSLRLKVLY